MTGKVTVYLAAGVWGEKSAHMWSFNEGEGRAISYLEIMLFPRGNYTEFRKRNSTTIVLSNQLMIWNPGSVILPHVYNLTPIPEILPQILPLY